METAFVTLDVFTDSTFGGNPLAVMTDARGLSGEQMLAITREFNYSESTFVLPPEDPANTARVRIFTPAEEIPFAGHPNVGTAVALARAGSVFGKPVGETVRFEEGIGTVSIDILRAGGSVAGAQFTAPGTAALGPVYDAEAIAGCIGLPADTVRTDRHAPRQVTLGIGFIFVELRDRDALARCEPSPERFRVNLPDAATRDVYCYVRDGDGPEIGIRARMFAPMHGIVEDPATGSAAAMLGALLSSVTPGAEDLAVSIDQGVEMGRPSRLEVGIARSTGAVERITVAGGAVSVMAGRLTI